MPGARPVAGAAAVSDVSSVDTGVACTVSEVTGVVLTVDRGALKTGALATPRALPLLNVGFFGTEGDVLKVQQNTIVFHVLELSKRISDLKKQDHEKKSLIFLSTFGTSLNTRSVRSHIL